MIVKGIIFDLDGVIVFTDKLHQQAWQKIADKKNIEFNESINNRLRGVSRMESLDIILEKYSGPALTAKEKEDLAEEKNRYYLEALKALTPSDVSPDVRDTLKALKDHGLLLAIGSSSKNAKYILKQVQLTDMFDAISDGTNISNSKPDPEVFLKAAEFLNLAPELCLVVEDACAGIDAAQAGGMKTVGIGDAYSYEKTDFPIKTLLELKNLVLAPLV